jgi:hypothetical protein
MSAELGEHVFEGRLGLGPIPRLGESTVVGVIGVMAVQGIPNHDQGLDQHPERDGPLDGVLDPVTGLPDTHLLGVAAGLHLLVHFDDAVDCAAVVARAAADGGADAVSINGTAPFQVGGPAGSSRLLSP